MDRRRWPVPMTTKGHKGGYTASASIDAEQRLCPNATVCGVLLGEGTLPSLADPIMIARAFELCRWQTAV